MLKTTIYPTPITDQYGERFTKLCLIPWTQAEALKDVPAGGGPCLCGATFANDFEFWAHYTVTDVRYSNLGECPVHLMLTKAFCEAVAGDGLAVLDQRHDLLLDHVGLLSEDLDITEDVYNRAIATVTRRYTGGLPDSDRAGWRMNNGATS